MAKNYHAGQWYWYVAGDRSRVFSTASGDYLPANDPAVVAWMADGTVPHNADSEQELGQRLATDNVARPVAVNVLDGYRDEHSRGIVAQTVFKVLFQHENRLRAIERALNLNGSPSNLTAGQARAAIKALM